MDELIERLAKEAEPEEMIRWAPIYGRVELSTFIDWRADAGYGMGRKRVFDEADKLVSDEVTELGSRIYWENSPEPIGWVRGLIAAIRSKFPPLQ